MGLDTSTLLNPLFYRTAEGASDDVDALYDNYTYVYANPGFPEHSEGYPGGFYEGQSSWGFRFSYGGYSSVRRSICNLTFGIEPEEIWNNFDMFRDCALAWFVHFSDCEGFIGPRTSAIIAAGFDALVSRTDYEDRAARESFWFPDAVQDIRTTFATAAESNGFVIYS